MWNRWCWYFLYCCIVLTEFTEENILDCDNLQIGILYDDIISGDFQGHPRNNCQLYSIDFSETYLVLQTALRMRKRDFDAILVPSYASKLIHIIKEKYLNTLNNGSFIGECLTHFKKLETISSTHKGSGRHLVITESGNYVEVQTAAALTSSIFRQLEWKLNVIFFDYSYASLADEFTKRLNKESNMQMLYNTDRLSNEGELLKLLKELYTDLADYHINFTILCNGANTRMLLKLASDFDQTKENFRHTSLRDHSSWFVVTAASYIDDDIGTNESILDNVMLLNLLNLHREEELNTEYYKYNMVEEEDVYYLYTLMWKGKTNCSPKCMLYRKFEMIGCIGSNGTLGVHSEFFPNSNFGFNSRHMLVTTIWWPPFTERMQKNGKTVSYYGYCMDLLRELGKALNFTYTVTEPLDGEFGRMLDNGSWSGMVGQLERRTVEGIVANHGFESTFVPSNRVMMERIDKKHPWVTDDELGVDGVGSLHAGENCGKSVSTSTVIKTKSNRVR